MIYANYRLKRGKNSAAKEQYDEALRIAPSSAEVNYNGGLFYLSQGDVTRAKQVARAAYEGGFPLSGLRRKIEAVEATQRAQ